jgi:hypothetical protein
VADPDATVLSTEAGALHAPTIAEDRTMAYAVRPPLPPPPAAPAPGVVRPFPPGASPPASAPRPAPAVRPVSPLPRVPAVDLPPPRDPTVTRRGRSLARRNLVFGGVALATAAGAVAVSLALGGDGDGARQCDEAGLCVTLPGGWSVGDVEPGRVTLHRDGVPVGAYTHEPSTSTGADGALNDAPGVDCADVPAAATVGGVAGARCETTGGGVAVAAVDGGRLWVVTLSGDVPGGEADEVIGSLDLG